MTTVPGVGSGWTPGAMGCMGRTLVWADGPAGRRQANNPGLLVAWQPWRLSTKPAGKHVPATVFDSW